MQQDPDLEPLTTLKEVFLAVEEASFLEVNLILQNYSLIQVSSRLSTKDKPPSYLEFRRPIANF